MEAIGAVNRYVCKKCHKDTFTINLNTGTTPFGLTCPHCKATECYSEFYRVGRAVYDLGKLTVTRCFYRPTKERLDELNEEFAATWAEKAPDRPPVLDCWDDHVLNGGLVDGPLGCPGVLPEDKPVPQEYAPFQLFAQATYGRQDTRHQ